MGKVLDFRLRQVAINADEQLWRALQGGELHQDFDDIPLAVVITLPRAAPHSKQTIF